MKFRLTKIITKHGDHGQTRLGNRSIVKKSAIQVEAIGMSDELNSAIGLLKVYVSNQVFKEVLTTIQHHLLILGSELAGSGRSSVKVRHIEFVEQEAYALMELLSPMQDFVLPEGGIAAAHCHMARTICRRAERQVVAASELDSEHTIMPMQYLNRLSDFLFVLARVLNQQEAFTETIVNREI